MWGNVALVSLLTAGLLGTGSTNASETLLTGRTLPADLGAAKVVDLLGGDQYKVYRFRDGTLLKGRRYDADSGTWGASRVLAHGPCQSFDVRSSAGAVVVSTECDFDSTALYSADAITWTTHPIAGYPYPGPGISSDGQHAAWATTTGVTTWDAVRGWVDHDLGLPAEGSSRGAVITDTGTVSLIGSDSSQGDGSPCTLTFWEAPGDVVVTTQQLAVPSCWSTGTTLVDDLTLQVGDQATPQLVTRISRPDEKSPWAVTAIAPVNGAGLAIHGGRLRTTFLSSPGLPLTALGSTDGRSASAQSYDPLAQQWSAATEVMGHAQGCHWNGGLDSVPSSYGVLAHEVTCKNRRRRLLVSSDGQRWRSVPLPGPPIGVAPSMEWVSATNSHRTLIFSQQRGVVRLPLGAIRPCDVVVPSAPDAALRLTARLGPRGQLRANGWPRELQRSTPGGWRRTDTKVWGETFPAATCKRATYEDFFRPPSYGFDGGGTSSTSLTITPRSHGWRVRGTRD